MELAVVIIFILGYLAITLEHTLKIDKLVPALVMMAICWAIVALGLDGFTNWFDPHHGGLVAGFESMDHESKYGLFEATLLHHLGKTSEILIFLIGAMTIVEITDHFDGFGAIKRFIKTTNKTTLLWIMAILAFFLSAVIDNLTATIVLITILKKLLPEAKDRLWFAGMIVVAANAGGAWSPIGDVTTTMLWMKNLVSTEKLLSYLFIPSALCMLIPTLIASFLPAFKGNFGSFEESESEENPASLKMLIIGISAILFVPIFKTVTHLPPYIGMMLSLGVVSIIAEIISSRQFSIMNLDDDAHHHSPVHKSLSRIEMPSLLFFLGILLTVAALESLGQLYFFAEGLTAAIPDNNIIVMLLGVGSAVVDNVPLVAASMSMFKQGPDSPLWHFIAYSAGTGGSMLIIGSAAGVVAMGMEKIAFFWYLKKISWLAVIGFLAGAITFMTMQSSIFENDINAPVTQIENTTNH